MEGMSAGLEGQHGCQLSADAREFVPTHDPASLPKYMFNCYPFVTEQGSLHRNNTKNSVQSGAPHHMRGPHHGSYSARKHHAVTIYPPPNGYAPHRAQTPANNTHYAPHRAQTPGMFTQNSGFTSPPPAPGRFYPPPRCTSPGSTLYTSSSPNMPAQYNGYVPAAEQATGRRSGIRPSRPQRPNTQSTPGVNNTWQHGTNAPHRKHQKQSSSVDRRPKISVGTQNEHGSKPCNNNKTGSSSSRSAARTIILVDTAAQTDFCSEIADHTLEQVPNALFQGKRKIKRKTLQSRSSHITGAHDSTDSEELDHSDSGYSSPMHRQNQISSGTDALTKTVPSTGTSQYGSQPVASVGRIDTIVTHSITNTQPVVTVSQSQAYHTTAIYSHEHQQQQHSLSHLPNVCMSYASAVVSSHQSNRPNMSSPLHNSMGTDLPSSQLQNPAAAQHNDGAISDEEADDAGDELPGMKKKKRKRGRRRRKRDKGGIDEENQDHQKSYTVTNEECQSPILSQESPSFNLLAPERMMENFPSFSEAGLYDDSTDCKLSGKRKKRREQANKAAIEEQLEIDLEQQALKVVNQTPAAIVKPTPIKHTSQPTVPQPSVPQSQSSQGGGKKSQQPLAINIMDFISAKTPSKPAPQPEADITAQSIKRSILSPRVGNALNPLDSTAPVLKRGKERETPKAKKPSALKKVILKEREERKRLRYIGEGPVDLISTPDSSLHFTSEPEENDDDDVISDMEEPNSLNSLADDLGTPHSQDLSPVSQNSPISVGLLSPPTSLSNPASGVGSPTVVGDIIQKIHSRRFREYCKQVLDKEIDANCTSLLQTLVKFQDRLYHKDPIKAKTKRRLVLGLREVTKHLKLRRVKLVIISPNLEKIQSKGGLDDALNMIINLCSEQDVAFVFALGRRSLGRACAKLVPVSVVGVFNYQGAETMYNDLINLTSKAREAYHEMVEALAKEIAEYGGALKGSCGLYFSHLGHSRTPSGCSAISFTSSILSEPLPEVKQELVSSGSTNPTTVNNNYNKQVSVSSTGSSEQSVGSLSSVQCLSASCSSVGDNRGPLQDDIYDIDEGNEADTEDNDTTNHKPLISNNTSLPSASLPSANEGVNADTEDTTSLSNPLKSSPIVESSKTYLNNNDKNVDVSSTYQERTMLSSIDTISQNLTQLSLVKKRSAHHSHRRSSSMGSHMDVRSQTSSRTLDQHDTVSTHSSVTIENACSESEHTSDPLGSSSSSCRLDRIKSWVQDVDTSSTPPNTEITRDDEEFNATYTACEANTDVLISRSRSPSVTNVTS